MLRNMSLTDYWRRVRFIQRRGTLTRHVLGQLQTLNAGVLNASARPFSKTFVAADFDFYKVLPTEATQPAVDQVALTQILSEVASIRP